MASSGYLNSSAYDGRRLRFEWSIANSEENRIETNTTKINWKLRSYGSIDSGYGYYYGGSFKVVIATKTVYSYTGERIPLWDDTVIKTGTYTFTHNDDGTKKFSVAIEGAIYQQYVNCSNDTVFTLDTIPRKSELTVANGTLGTEQTLKVTQKSSNFKHSVRAECGSSTVYIKADGTTQSSEVIHNDTSFPFTPPLSWASKNTTGTSLAVDYIIRTYNGDTYIGGKTYTKTLTIPSTVKPSVSKIEVSDTAGHFAKYGAYIVGHSKLSVKVTASQAYSSPIASYSAKVNGSTYKAASFTTGALSSTNISVVATVTDSRSRTSDSYTQTVSPVWNYSKPKISSFKIHRCKSGIDGTEDMQGEFAQITFSGSVTSLDNQNSSNFVLKYKKTTEDDTAWVSVPLSTAYSVTDATYIFAADSGSSYNVKIEASDDFTGENPIVSSTTLSTATVIEHWRADGKGMGFGKVGEVENGMDVGWDAVFRKTLVSTSDIGAPFRNIHPKGAEMRFGVGSAGTNRGIYDATAGFEHWMLYSDGTDTRIGSQWTTTGLKPYIRTGDTLSVALRTAGFVTGSSAQVHFMIPLSRYTVGSPEVSVTTTSLILRQGGSYTHGSSSSKDATVSSSSATLYTNSGVAVILTLSATTNATNNAPIGIYWSGSITFS